MGTKIVDFTTDEILKDIRSFAHKHGLSEDLCNWPQEAILYYSTRITGFGKSYTLPWGPHIKIKVNCRPHPNSPDSHYVEMNQSLTGSSKLAIVLALPFFAVAIWIFAIVDLTNIMSIIGFIVFVVLTVILLAYVLIIDQKDFKPLFWKECFHSAPSQTPISAQTKQQEKRTSLFGLSMGLIAIAIALVGTFYFLSHRDYMLGSMFISSFGACGVILLIGFMFLGLFLFPLFPGLQFLTILRSVLLTVSLMGLAWLLAIYTWQIWPTIEIIGSYDISDIPIQYLYRDPTASSMGFLDLSLIALGQLMLIGLVILFPIVVRKQLAISDDMLRSANHRDLVEQQQQARSRWLLQTCAWPLIILQLSAWIVAIAAVPYFIMELFFRDTGVLLREFISYSGPVLLQQLGVGSSIFSLGDFREIEITWLGNAVTALLLLLLMLPWLIPISSAIRRIRLHWNDTSKPFTVRQLDQLPIVSRDLARIEESIGKVKISLHWDVVNERTAYYRRINKHRFAIVINPILWAAAKTGDSKPMRFVIYHEAAHIRRELRRSRWRIFSWLCPPTYGAIRVLLSPGFKEEFDCDIETSKALGRPQEIAQVIRTFRGKPTSSNQIDLSWSAIWESSWSSFYPDSYFFTPSPQQRATWLESQSVSNRL